MLKLASLEQEIALERDRLQLKLRGASDEKITQELESYDQQTKKRYRELQEQLKIDLQQLSVLNKSLGTQIADIWMPSSLAEKKEPTVTLAEDGPIPMRVLQHQDTSPQAEGASLQVYFPPYDYSEEHLRDSLNVGYQVHHSMNSTVEGQLYGDVRADNPSSGYDLAFVFQEPSIGFWHRMDRDGRIDLAFGGIMNAFHSSTQHRDEFGLSHVLTRHESELFVTVTNDVFSETQTIKLFRQFSQSERGRWNNSSVPGFPKGRLLTFAHEFDQPFPVDDYVFIRIGLRHFLFSFSDDVEVYSTFRAGWRIPLVAVRTR